MGSIPNLDPVGNREATEDRGNVDEEKRTLLGVDGCRGGWVVARATTGLDAVSFALYPTFCEVLTAAGRSSRVAVDIPIGLAEAAPRACDLAARTFLPPRRKSSVFPAPCRATLAAKDYRDACERNRAARGKGVTKQLFHILDKIREVDQGLAPETQEWLSETHPEVVFAVLAGADANAIPAKKVAAGRERRVALLARSLPFLDEPWLSDARSSLSRQRPDVIPAGDDLVDALACLVAAERITRGVARHFPDSHADYDARGLRMEIVA